jgi:DNA-binding NtrC family response regulator
VNASAPGEARLGRVVVVEDDPVLLEQLTWALKGKFDVSAARDATHGRALCDSEPDLYLFDLRLPPSGTVEEGLNLLRHVRRRDPDATVVIMSGEKDRAAALKAMSNGAFDFFRKDVDLAELLVVLRRALERRRLLVENRELREAAQAPASDEARIVGESVPMKRLLADVRRIAESEASVLLVGESGSGKELVARAIHAGSPRRGRAFVAVNAAALPESLAEAELFGHEKGAFTGAVSSRPGRFELAQGGTLFLDEIGTLTAGVQSKLLRALETREVERVGGRRPIAVDFRLVSATNESLEDRISAGTFREDLFYRINAVVVRIPPLRERAEDVPLLADHFLRRLAARHGRGPKTLSPAVVERLKAHPWRGNVRELRHAIETLVLFSDGPEIGEEDLPRALRSGPSLPGANGGGRAAAKDFATSVADFERGLLADAIAQAGGVKAEAARRLGLDSNQIKYLCRKYGL